MLRKSFLIILIAVTVVQCHSTQRPSSQDDANPFLDMATAFLQETLTNQNGGGGGGGGLGAGGIGGIASLIGSMMQSDGGKSDGGGGAGVLLSGIGSLLANANGGNGFDPSIIGNVIEMFTAGQDSGRSKRETKNSAGGGGGLDLILSLAQTFLSSQNDGQQTGEGGRNKKGGQSNEGLGSLLPIVMQTLNSFVGPEAAKREHDHKAHAWILPPFLENIHIMWDHFTHSELADALWEKAGLNEVFKGFVGRDSKIDYDKLFDSLENQSFRRRWLKTGIQYLADKVIYFADPDVQQRYFSTAQRLVNGFLKSNNYPKTTFIDIDRPSETFSNLIDYTAKRHLQVKVHSIQYIKPAIIYVQDLLKLGKARGLLQQFNATEISDKLTDTLNLEVIEPVLKVYRAYRYINHDSECDRFILCDLNSHDPNEKLGLAGFKSGITKVGSMAAAWFVSLNSETPFWTLFSIINNPYNCKAKYPSDCTAFYDGEAKVTKEYIHNEL